jgi:hypothetical protein
MSTDEWDPEEYRVDVWENERWRWLLRKPDDCSPKVVRDGDRNLITRSEDGPKPGDTVFFFFAKNGTTRVCPEPGFYGWGVILKPWDEQRRELHFRPTSPSDQLEMRPWWEGDGGGEAKQVADDIRQPFPMGTLWGVRHEHAQRVRAGIFTWVGGH